MFKKRLRRLSLVVLCMIFTVSLMACGGSSNSTQADTTAAGSAVTGGTAAGDSSNSAAKTDADVKGTVKFASDVYNIQDWEKISVSFAEKYPNIEVQYEQLPVDSQPKDDKLKTWFATGAAPDVIEFPGPDTWVPTYQTQLEALDDYIAKDSEFKIDTMSPGSVEYLKQYVNDGKIHSLPGQVNPGGMLYNKTVFDKFGVSYPTNDMTWEQVFDLAKKITRTDGGQKYFGLWFSNFDSNSQTTNMMRASGLVEMSADTKKTEFDNPLAKQIMDMIYMVEGDPQITVSYNEYIGNKMSFDQFNQGNIGMWPESLWTVSNLRMLQKAGEAQFEWGIVTYPHFTWMENNEGLQPVIQPTAITTTSQNKDAAWIFLKWYFSDEFQKARSGIGVIPSTTTPAVMEAFKNGEAGLDNYDTVAQQKYANVHINTDPKTANYEMQYNSEVTKIMDKFMLRNITSEEALKEKKALAQKIFDSIE